MLQRIQNCYDSHTHFLATGQVASGLQLQGLKSAEDVVGLKIQSSHFRGEWLTGFGWDHNLWNPQVIPNKKTLDLLFPKTPVLFSRVDGHASWLNSKGLQILKQAGCEIAPADELSGILFEKSHIQALSLLPEFSDKQQMKFLEASQKIFNQAGFTHVRDLSMNLKISTLLSEMYHQQKLTVCLDSFVTAENRTQVSSVIDEVLEIRKKACPYLKVRGVKIFIDGSLGSKTALLSENYIDSISSGLFLWPYPDLVEAMALTWKAGLDFAVHCIGDQASYEVVKAARENSSIGILGRLHLEHVEVLRSETIQMMKPLHVTCYLQPCHWLSDHEWLVKVLPQRLQKNIFQWELLRKNKIPFFFGSDSPIEMPSLFLTQKALTQSAELKVPALQEDWKKYHAHPDSNWTKSWTEFDHEKIVQVYFDGLPLLQNEKFIS